MERTSSSSDSSEEGKTPTQSPAAIAKFHKGIMANRNATRLEENETNCSSLDTLKDYSFYSKSLDESKLDKVNSEFENSGGKELNKRYSLYADGSYCFKKNVDPRNSYVINNDTNLLELSMTISDCDNTEAPYSILNTINMTDSSIMSSSGSDTVVQRRQRKKKRSDTKKRVSFHEDILKTMKLEDDENYSEFSMSFMPPNSVQKKDVQKGRYSWCGNGDSPYVQKNIVTRNANSDYYSSASSLSGFENDTDKNATTPKLCGEPICQKNSKCSCELSIAERGVPEGQEDPGKSFRPKIEIELEENEAQEAYVAETQCGNIIEEALSKVEMQNKSNQKKYASSSDWSDVDSTTTSEFDDRRNSRHLSSPLKKRNVTAILSGEANKLASQTLRQATSKSSLLSRFLRSVTERKFEGRKAKKPQKPNPLYIKGVKVGNQESFKDFNDNLEKEIQENVAAEKQEFSGEKVGLKLRETFKRQIYRDKTEELYKVYKVRSSYMTNGESKPMLALLTDKTLYLTASKIDHSYSNQFVIPYNELDVIMVRDSLFFKTGSLFYFYSSYLTRCS